MFYEHNNEIYAGINSVNGYINLLETQLAEVNTLYILKGSPGSGKSTLLKSLKKHSGNIGEAVTVIRCSADPNSYDAVIFHGLNIAVADGTAPHILEPKIAGARDRIVNLGDCWSDRAIADRGNEITEISTEKARYISDAYKLLKAYGEVEKVYDSYCEKFIDHNKITAYALRFFEKYIKTEQTGFINIFQNEVFCGMGFDRTQCVEAKTKILVREKFNVGSRFLKELLNLAKCGGVKTLVSLSPVDAKKIGSLYFPDDDILVKSDKFIPFEGDKTVSADRFINKIFMKKNKEKLAFLRKLQKQLLAEAAAMFENAGSEHDKIEKIYFSAIDFEKINQKTIWLKNEIFGV